jgi:thermitase
VGIIDEGIMASHLDLGVNVFVNPFDPVDGVDNDGNGYVDDVRGWDFDGNNNSTYDGSQDDHGTHVAGTIGASGGNAIGVAGMNWNVTMIPAKFLGRRGGTTANAIKAVDYLTDLKLRHGFNIVATNNSWGGGGFSQGLLDAINRGGNAGILFVAAAGNGGRDGAGDNNDTTASYPSNYQCTSNGKAWDCVIAVAAITSTGAKSGFSNYGATTVDLGAPGSAIFSTLPTKQSASTYGSYSGTSMATPHVTGAAALYASTHPGATAAQIKAAILGATIPTTSLAGRTVTGGRLNVSGF